MGPDGLLKMITKTVLESALEAEMTEHLGHEKNRPPADGDIRNGHRPKTLLTVATGEVAIEVPRGRADMFARWSWANVGCRMWTLRPS